MNGKRHTILVVDDVPDDIAIIDEILKYEYQVKAVTSGEAALKIAQGDNPPDLILLDIMMPGMDGFEVCRRLKRDARGTLIPVIFLTAKVANSDEKIGLELGAVDYIRKPIEPEIVRTRVELHLERKDYLLRSSEVRFRRLFETAQDGVIIVDTETGIIVDANPSMAAILGVSQEYFLGKRVSELEFLQKAMEGRVCSSEAARPGYVRYKEQPMQTVDGRMIYVEFVCNSYEVNDREMTQYNIRDITNLVQAERERDELAARLSHYLATSPTVTYSLKLKDGVAHWQWVSENIQLLLGYTSEEALEPDWWFGNINANDRGGALGSFIELAKNGTCVREYRFRRKDREAVWLRDEMRLVHEGGALFEVVGTLTDITARKKSLEQLEDLLRERSELLREIHHRVNNNVQVLTSLLSISAQPIEDAKLRTKLEDIARRMQSMAIIHRQFYESEDLSRIDFAVYLDRLLESLKPEFPSSAGRATVACQSGLVLLGLEQAIPAGLIASELLTNALKFAFPEAGEDGVIMVTQRQTFGNLEIEVRDNGVGLPKDFDPLQAETLGMVFVRILAQQLGGKIEFIRGAGTTAVLSFPIEERRRPA